MKRLYFTKMSGAGNDFILFDKKINPDIELSARFIADLCRKHTGVGADGVILISDSNNTLFEMNYFNSDGSTGSLCANGARCAVQYGKLSGRYNNEKIKFKSNGLEYSGAVLDNGLVQFFLNHPKKMKQNFKIKVWNQLISASYADTGAPHIIININDVLKDPADENSCYDEPNGFPVFELGKEIRYH
ncbi:MAG: diaminopimelate epimerase, partial [Ignavibacteriae bacterium HGW-Ignavibacteriae-3]